MVPSSSLPTYVTLICARKRERPVDMIRGGTCCVLSSDGCLNGSNLIALRGLATLRIALRDHNLHLLFLLAASSGCFRLLLGQPVRVSCGAPVLNRSMEAILKEPLAGSSVRQSAAGPTLAFFSSSSFAWRARSCASFSAARSSSD